MTITQEVIDAYVNLRRKVFVVVLEFQKAPSIHALQNAMHELSDAHDKVMDALERAKHVDQAFIINPKVVE